MPCRRCKLRAGKFREVSPAKLPMPTTLLCCTTPVLIEEARETLLLDLMRRVARKEEVALTPLYRQLSHTIRAFALRRLNDPIVADEIVVDTMYEVWRHGHRYEGRSRVTTWVLGIARHKILDRQRQRSANRFEELGEEADSVPDGTPDIFLHLAEHQRAEQIAVCIQALPVEQRQCIHLVFFEDLSMAEVAKIQQCPVNTVKTRLFHARRKLRSSLEQQLSSE